MQFMASLFCSWTHGNLSAYIPGAAGRSAAVNVPDDLMTKFDGSSQRLLMFAIIIYRSRERGEGVGIHLFMLNQNIIWDIKPV